MSPDPITPRVARFEFAVDGDAEPFADGCVFGRGLAVVVDRATGTPTTYQSISHLALAHPRGDVRWIDTAEG